MIRSLTTAGGLGFDAESGLGFDADYQVTSQSRPDYASAIAITFWPTGPSELAEYTIDLDQFPGPIVNWKAKTSFGGYEGTLGVDVGVPPAVQTKIYQNP